MYFQEISVSIHDRFLSLKILIRGKKVQMKHNFEISVIDQAISF